MNSFSVNAVGQHRQLRSCADDQKRSDLLDWNSRQVFFESLVPQRVTVAVLVQPTDQFTAPVATQNNTPQSRADPTRTNL